MNGPGSSQSEEAASYPIATISCHIPARVRVSNYHCHNTAWARSEPASRRASQVQAYIEKHKLTELVQATRGLEPGTSGAEPGTSGARTRHLRPRPHRVGSLRSLPLPSPPRSLLASSPFAVQGAIKEAVKTRADDPAAVMAAHLLKGKSDKPMVVFVLGGPGAGKGTQCAKIVEQCLPPDSIPQPPAARVHPPASRLRAPPSRQTTHRRTRSGLRRLGIRIPASTASSPMNPMHPSSDIIQSRRRHYTIPLATALGTLT